MPPQGGVDFDPNNAVLPGEGSTHVTLACGRDFGDATPLGGVIGGGGHVLTAAVSVIPFPDQPGISDGRDDEGPKRGFGA